MIRTELIASIGELLQRHATQRPNKTAFEDSTGAAITYAQLNKNSASLAIELANMGVALDDSVAVLLPNSVDWVLSCFGVLRAGGICVPISHEAVEGEVRYRLEDASCNAVIVSVQQLALIQKIQPDLPALRIVIVADELPSKGVHSLGGMTRSGVLGKPRDPTDVTRLSFVVYTSGTTGKAKGVMLSLHSMLWVTATCWAPIAGLCESDVVLSALPLYHSYALNLSVLGILAVGATEYLQEKFSTQETVRLLQTGRFSLMPGVPTIFHYLLETSKSASINAFSGIRYFISAGAILPAALNLEFEQFFGTPLLDGYGITETSTMVTMNWPGAARIPGSCGLPLPGLATRIVNPDGQDVPLGGEGELIVRGPNVMMGYLNKPNETMSSLRDGWYRTGDLAKSDANGFLTITGRLKELIIRGGQNIAPAEVEDALLRHPDVLDCAAIGMPHPLLGEVPVACVIPREGKLLDVSALREHCTTLLSAYKIPHEIHVVASIPRTGSGKIMRFKLRSALTDKSATYTQ